MVAKEGFEPPTQGVSEDAQGATGCWPPLLPRTAGFVESRISSSISHDRCSDCRISGDNQKMWKIRDYRHFQTKGFWQVLQLNRPNLQLRSKDFSGSWVRYFSMRGKCGVLSCHIGVVFCQKVIANRLSLRCRPYTSISLFYRKNQPNSDNTTRTDPIQKNSLALNNRSWPLRHD
jgi:hypothetical protein